MADPAFQVALRKAQIGAASTERDNDYDILAALIEDRAKRADDRPVRAGINRAIEIVDQMDSQALRGLTVYAAAAQYSPLNGDVDEGLGAMDRMLEQLSEGLELPSGRAWIEHLDVLGAVRQDSIQSFKKLADYWTEKTPGYLSVGLPAGAEEGTAAIAELRDVHRISVAPVPHTFKPGYERLPFTGSNGFRSLLVGAGKSDAEAEAAAAVASSAYKLDERDDSLVPAYRERLCTLPTLNQIAGWWDEFAVFFSVTPVGSVVARANSKRLDKAGFLPPIE
ncbi:hypothetical protein ASG91_12255 [Phycicoccus sp. Soil802]|nr:hypothetical protein ASG91_12255 [Phycicoccus sp. Soil802]